VLCALVLTACGSSGEDTAQQTVCDARQDVSKQVDELRSLTPATLKPAAVSEHLAAIRSDLSTIKDAQADLNDDRRKQVEAANQAFRSEVEDVAKQMVAGAAAGDAASTISTATQQLASSYEQTFARIDCD
jgi:hypothetical protein